MNTYYGVISFSGDPEGEHPDPELRGRAPQLLLIACGTEESCWDALADWTRVHGVRLWEEAEVLLRDSVGLRSRYRASLRGS